ncbi:MAG: cytochrome D1 domain-containing protein [Nitrospinota bacterium]
MNIVDTTMADSNGAKLYADNCADCHHTKRVGLTAPPLIPGLYSRKNAKRLASVISEGLPATRMRAFKNKLTDAQINEIVAYIKTPVDRPEWSFDDILKSRSLPDNQSPKKNSADLTNITLVMERGTKSLIVLDGETLSELAKFYVGNVHGGPKFSYDLKKIYSVSRDGIVTRFDVQGLTTELRFKAGIYTRSIAVAPDNEIIAVANQLPRNIVFFDGSMKPIHEIATPDKIGGFYSLPQLDAFICSFREKPEFWLIDAKPPFNVTKEKIPAPFEDFSISPVGSALIGTKRGSDSLYVYDYKKKKVLAQIHTEGLPHLASAAFWYRNGELMVAVNHIKKPMATIYSLDSLKMEAEIPLPGAGFFVRTHYATPYLWVDTMTDELILIDKNDFSRKKVIKNREGRKTMHVEFTKEGKYALVTVPGKGGEVEVYDAGSLSMVKTIPYDNPVGKYNSTNKTFPAFSMGVERKTKVKSRGQEVFENYCMGCHHQVYEAFGPSFKEIAEKRTPAEIRMHILNPKADAKKHGYKRSSMSHIKLSGEDMDNIVAYILTFRRGSN